MPKPKNSVVGTSYLQAPANQSTQELYRINHRLVNQAIEKSLRDQTAHLINLTPDAAKFVSRVKPPQQVKAEHIH